MAILSWLKLSWLQWRPPDLDEEDFLEEIRAHLAIAEDERVADGANRQTAHDAALKEFGNVTLTRDSMRDVWRSRWLDAAEALARDIRFAFRSLLHAKGLAVTVVVSRLLGAGFPGMEFDSGPVTVGATAFLITVALIACYLPTRSASRISALEALRLD